MMGKTHKIGGAVSGFSLLTIANFININLNPIFVGIPFLAGNVLGALIPDIDQKKSTIGRILWIISFPIWIFQRFLNFLLRKSKSKLAKAIKSTINHRGFAHWPSIYILGIFVTFVIVKLFSIDMNSLTFKNIYASFTSLIGNTYEPSVISETLVIVVLSSFIYGICFGAINHILLDSLNPQGVPLFAPFSIEKKSYGNIITGATSKKEKRFRFLLKIILFAFICLFIYSLTLNTNISFIFNLGPTKVDLINPL